MQGAFSSRPIPAANIGLDRGLLLLLRRQLKAMPRAPSCLLGSLLLVFAFRGSWTSRVALPSAFRSLASTGAKHCDARRAERLDIFDYLAGAVFSLEKCHDLRFWNRQTGFLSGYKNRIAEYLRQIPSGLEPTPYWVSGYFVNSAMIRVAACYDRIPKLILKKKKLKDGETAHSLMKSLLDDPSRYANWNSVYTEVNRLKHDKEGLAPGRQVSKDEITKALVEIVSLLEEKQGDLLSSYVTGENP